MTEIKTLRNIGIVLLLAAVVDLAPGGGTAWNVLLQAISLGFLGAIAWIASRLYREHRIALYSLGPKRRAILYGAVGLATFAFTATDKLWKSSGGSIAWLVIVAVAGYAVFWVYRANQEY